MAYDGLAAVVSDAPEHLRASGGGSQQDRLEFGDRLAVSDAPENLRAKRRDVEAHKRILDALAGTPQQA
jgi:hypothetical protein